jgi:mitogen-activated protein kinase 1/3
MKLVGSGAYGCVIQAEDKQAKNEKEKFVAIKKIERAFEHRLYAKRTLRELKILRLIKHENVLMHKIIIDCGPKNSSATKIKRRIRRCLHGYRATRN